jgi:hypothetical protein
MVLFAASILNPDAPGPALCPFNSIFKTASLPAARVLGFAPDWL